MIVGVVVDTFRAYEQVTIHLVEAKRCYAIINQKYTEYVFARDKDNTDGLDEDEIEYVVRLMLHDDERRTE